MRLAAGKVGNVQLRLSLVMSIAVAAESMASIPNKRTRNDCEGDTVRDSKEGTTEWEKDLREASVSLTQGGRYQEDPGSTMEEEIWGSEGPTYIEEEEDDSGEGEKNIRDEITSVEEDEGESMQCAQRSTRGIGGWEEEDD
ncbi:hypothetical protein BGX38DRAFT_1144107 [Terfezia claveryi]|nr:hypothetical protein BGX38DRAFT_1144107 [Terfezia claveryi]